MNLSPAIIGFAGAAMIVVGVTSCALEGRAHDALPTAAQPLGWSYPLACCSGYDCREVGEGSASAVRVHERGAHYVISTTGEVIPETDRRVKPSPDGVFHWCSKGGRDDSATICLFVPPKGF